MRKEQWKETYQNESEIYESFSRYEDKHDKTFRRLLDWYSFANRTILDVGCGTGAYTEMIAQRSDRYYGLDMSRPMLEIATSTIGTPENGAFVRAMGEQLPLPDSSVDGVFAAWFLSAIPDQQTRATADREIERVLRKGGDVWLFDNYCTGEFMEIRDMALDHPETWKHPLNDYGYEHVEVVSTQFDFPTLEEAKRVFGFLFGERAIVHLDDTRDPTIEHDVLILHKRIDH